MRTLHASSGRALDARRRHSTGGQDWELDVSYGALYPGHGQPLFMISARHVLGKLVTIGPLPEVILAELPEFADLLPWNKCRFDGLPARYAADAVEAAEKFVRSSPPDPAGVPPALVGHLRCHQVGDRDELVRQLAAWAAGDPAGGEAGFRAWLTGREPAMRSVFEAAMRRHDVDEISVSPPDSPAPGAAPRSRPGRPPGR